MKFTITTLAIVLASLVNTIYAQCIYPKADFAERIKTKGVLVELLNMPFELANTLNSISDSKIWQSDAQIFNRDFIPYYNSFIRENFEKHWPFPTKVSFITSENIQILLKNQDTNYVVFSTRLILQKMISMPSTKSYYPTLTYSIYDLADAKERYSFTKDYIPKTVFYVALTQFQASENDLIFVMQQFKNYIDAASAGIAQKDYENYITRLSKLKIQTLLFDQISFKENFDTSTIKMLYPNKYAIMPSDSISKIITEKRQGFAYITTLNSFQQGQPCYVIVNATDGEILSVIGQGSVNVSVDMLFQKHSASELNNYNRVHHIRLGKDHIKAIANPFAQKINN